MAGGRVNKQSGSGASSVVSAEKKEQPQEGASSAMMDPKDAKVLQAEWEKRPTVSARALVDSWKMVSTRLVSAVVAAIPSAEPLAFLCASLWSPEKVEEKVAVLEKVPESVRYIIYSTLTAMLMETKHLVADLCSVPEAQRDAFLMQLAEFIQDRELYGLASPPIMMQGGHAPQAGSRMIHAGVYLGLAEYVISKGPSAGMRRPAVVVELHEDNSATLAVHFAMVDVPHESSVELQRVPFSAEVKPGTWFHEGVGAPMVKMEEPFQAAAAAVTKTPSA